MKQKFVPLFGIAFVVAVIATGVFYGLFVGKLRSASDSPRYAIVVAKHPIVRGSVLQDSDVHVAAWSGTIPPGTFTGTEKVIGFTAIDGIPEGQPVTETKLATHKAIPQGMRAISVHVSDSTGVVSMIAPGNKVDVQVVSTGRGEPALRTVLQNVEVLSVASPDNSRLVVNLLVSPEDGDVIGLADSVARVRLALRNPADDARPTQPSLSVGELLKAPVARPRASSATDPKLTGRLKTQN